MTNEVDRIQNAIGHIQTAIDVDEWAMEIAVGAMEKQMEDLKNSPTQMSGTSDLISRQAAIDEWKNDFKGYVNMLDIPKDDYNGIMAYIDELPSVQPKLIRTFVELVVEYPDPELCTYKEYKEKPYYSIKYIENGEKYVGYGTYNPEVLSQYLKEYFISSALPEPYREDKT